MMQYTTVYFMEKTYNVRKIYQEIKTTKHYRLRSWYQIKEN